MNSQLSKTVTLELNEYDAVLLLTLIKRKTNWNIRNQKVVVKLSERSLSHLLTLIDQELSQIDSGERSDWENIVQTLRHSIASNGFNPR